MVKVAHLAYQLEYRVYTAKGGPEHHRAQSVNVLERSLDIICGIVESRGETTGS